MRAGIVKPRVRVDVTHGFTVEADVVGDDCGGGGDL